MPKHKYQFLENDDWYYPISQSNGIYRIKNKIPFKLVSSYKKYLEDCLEDKKIKKMEYNGFLKEAEKIFEESYVSSVEDNIESISEILKLITDRRKFTLFSFINDDIINSPNFITACKNYASSLYYVNDDNFFKRFDYQKLVKSYKLYDFLKIFNYYYAYVDPKDISEYHFRENAAIILRYDKDFLTRYANIMYIHNPHLWSKILEYHSINIDYLPSSVIMDELIFHTMIKSYHSFTINYLKLVLPRFTSSLVKQYHHLLQSKDRYCNLPVLVNMDLDLSSENYEYIKELMKYKDYRFKILQLYKNMPLQEFFDDDYDYSEFLPIVNDLVSNPNLLIKIFQEYPYAYYNLDEWNKKNKTNNQKYIMMVPNIFRYMEYAQKDIDLSKLAINLDVNNIKYVSKETLIKILN